MASDQTRKCFARSFNYLPKPTRHFLLRNVDCLEMRIVPCERPPRNGRLEEVIASWPRAKALANVHNSWRFPSSAAHGCGASLCTAVSSHRTQVAEGSLHKILSTNLQARAKTDSKFPAARRLGRTQAPTRNRKGLLESLISPGGRPSNMIQVESSPSWLSFLTGLLTG